MDDDIYSRLIYSTVIYRVYPLREMSHTRSDKSRKLDKQARINDDKTHNEFVKVHSRYFKHVAAIRKDAETKDEQDGRKGYVNKARKNENQYKGREGYRK